MLTHSNSHGLEGNTQRVFPKINVPDMIMASTLLLSALKDYFNWSNAFSFELARKGSRLINLFGILDVGFVPFHIFKSKLPETSLRKKKLKIKGNWCRMGNTEWK